MTDSSPEIQRERAASCFPVTKDAVDQALAKISENPDRVAVETGALLQADNPDLNLMLMSLLQTGPRNMDQGPVIEGALWTYRILNEQAELNGKRVPHVSRDVCTAHLHDVLETVKMQTSKDPNVNFGDLVTDKVKDAIKEEPYLQEALNELTKYRGMKSLFYQGVSNVLFPIKKSLESIELRRKLNF